MFRLPSFVRPAVLFALPIAMGRVATPAGHAPNVGAAAQPEAQLQRTVDSVAQRVMSERGIPGAAVAIVRGDRIALMTGYGEASREKGEKVTPDTRFQIASLTKPFTATAVMLLVNDGVLRLDDRVSVYLPWLPMVYDSATVRELLNHSSGIRRDVRTSNNDDITLDEFRRRVQRAPSSFPHGTAFEYANAGYIVLGLVIEKITKDTYEKFLTERVLRPAGMRNARYLERPGDASVAVGHEPVDKVQQRAPYFSGGFAAGGLSSTVRDVANFAIALHRGTVIPPARLREMWTAGRLADGRQIVAFGDSTRSYGYGWEVRNAGGRKSVAHGGGLSGFSSTFIRFDDGTTVIVLANSKIGEDRVGHSEAIANAMVASVVR